MSSYLETFGVRELFAVEEEVRPFERLSTSLLHVAESIGSPGLQVSHIVVIGYLGGPFTIPRSLAISHNTLWRAFLPR